MKRTQAQLDAVATKMGLPSTQKPVDNRTEEQRKLDSVNRYVESTIERAQETAKELSEKLTKSLLSAEYAIRWMQGTYEIIYTGALAEELKGAFENPDWKDKTKSEILDMYVQQLQNNMRHWYPEHSTSPISNACNDEKFNALRRWIQQLERA